MPHALAVMAFPTIVSQLITLIYNLADTWFVGQTNNPYMVAACSLALPAFLLTIVITNVYGTGGRKGGRSVFEAERKRKPLRTVRSREKKSFRELCRKGRLNRKYTVTV